jgi:hypothetical protein
MKDQENINKPTQIGPLDFFKVSRKEYIDAFKINIKKFINRDGGKEVNSWGIFFTIMLVILLFIMIYLATM